MIKTCASELVLVFVFFLGSTVAIAQDQPAGPPSIDQKILKQLVDRAKQTESDALIIWKDDNLIYESYFGKPRGPIEAMSATKSIVALAFGPLIAGGKLNSLDEPVWSFYPEWNQGKKATITIKHLLTQRSGLQCEARTTAIYRSPDFVQLALCAELAEDPGTRWRYNNKACNLLPGIVQRISGQRMDRLIGERIFRPLGITDWSWSLDTAGNPHGMSGLQIRPEDLVKIGQLMLDHGNWEGQQILSRDFVTACVTDPYNPPKPADTTQIDFLHTKSEELATKLGYGARFSHPYGLLWWLNIQPEVGVTDRLLELWKSNGVDEAFLKKMQRLKGYTGDGVWQRMAEEGIGESEFMSNIVEKNQLDWDVLSWRDDGYSAEGYLGQYLVVVPRHRMVAVRMRRAPQGEFDDRQIDAFKDFKGLVARLGISK